MQRTLPFVLFGAFFALSACNQLNSDLERAAVGAAIGCVAGEVLVDGRCVEGAVIGGATGALSDRF